MRIVILGANGPTGRLLTGQILAAGHDGVALTRRSADFPLADPRLAVVGGDVLDPAAVDSVVDGSDAVLSTLGTPFTRQPVEVYSRGAQNWRSPAGASPRSTSCWTRRNCAGSSRMRTGRADEPASQVGRRCRRRGCPTRWRDRRGPARSGAVRTDWP